MGEVAEAGEGAGAERAECGGVLPGAGVVRSAILHLGKAATRGGRRARSASRSAHEVRGSATGSGRVGARRERRGMRVRPVRCAASVSRAAGDVRVEILLKNRRSLRVGPGLTRS